VSAPITKARILFLGSSTTDKAPPPRRSWYTKPWHARQSRLFRRQQRTQRTWCILFLGRCPAALAWVLCSHGHAISSALSLDPSECLRHPWCSSRSSHSCLSGDVRTDFSLCVPAYTDIDICSPTSSNTIMGPKYSLPECTKLWSRLQPRHQLDRRLRCYFTCHRHPRYFNLVSFPLRSQFSPYSRW
jgi:hypothetical protein